FLRRCIVALTFSRFRTTKRKASISKGGYVMRSAGKYFVSTSLVLAFACITAWAQGTAQITGTIRDASGAVLPGAEVTATQMATGVARNVVSNEAGLYVLP